MPTPDLAELLAPGRCALVTQECQVGVIGPGAVLRDLAEEAQRTAIPNMVRLVDAARAAGIPVVHCLALRRPDDLGSNRNARLFHATRKYGVDVAPGGPGAALLAELGPAPSDLVLTRYHGIGPMGGTDLGPVLRNLGVDVIVGVGVSVNVAITNFVMDAVNSGFTFVLARDAVAGVPRDYADAVIDNTLALLTTVTMTDRILELW